MAPALAGYHLPRVAVRAALEARSGPSRCLGAVREHAASVAATERGLHFAQWSGGATSAWCSPAADVAAGVRREGKVRKIFGVLFEFWVEPRR
jgi:hypothetical protein